MNFSNILYWCEFPHKTDWKKVSSNLGKKKARTYIASHSPEEYHEIKEKVSKYKNIIIEGVWPILSKEKGYWFSSFTKKKDIDVIKKFKGLKIKIDIEPPMPSGNNIFSLIKWIFKYLIIKPRNRDYLLKTLKEYPQENILISTFPFPEWILKRYGWSKDFKYYNYMHYSSFVPRILKPLYNFYYRAFVKKHKTEYTYFAVGLLDVGIFGNEPIYRNITELKKDLEFFKSLNIKNVLIFRLGSLERKEVIKLLL